MWSRRRIALVSVAVGFTATFAWLAFHSSEPSYHGKSLSVWLEEARTNQELSDALADVQIDSPAARAVRAMGKRALPALTRMARTRDTALRRRLLELSVQHPWMGMHPQSFEDIQMKSAYGFLVLGPAAKPAVPELISMLDDPSPEVRVLAAFALGKIGPDAVAAIPQLRQMIDKAAQRGVTGMKWRDADKWLAAYALGGIGPAARPALRQIMSLKNDPNFMVRAAADAALVRIAGEGLGPILDTLKDYSNSTNWLFAVQAVHLMGTNGAPAIPFLIQGLQHTNQDLRAHVVRTLGAIHTRSEVCIPALLPLLQLSNTNAGIRSDALDAIRNFGSAARGLMPISELVRCLDDPEESVRRHATNALRQLDPEAVDTAGIGRSGRP